MTPVSISVTDPDAIDAFVGAGRWLVSGATAAEVATAGDSSGAAAVASFLRRYPNASVIALDGGSVVLGRGLHSGHERFYTIVGNLVISDHFRNVSTMLARDSRVVDEYSVLYLYLFAASFGRRTPLAPIRKLGLGDVAELTRDSRDPEPRVVDRLDVTPDLVDTEEILSTIDEALGRAMEEALRGAGATAIQFSGGVDSTLLRSYGDAGVDTVSMAPDVPEFAQELDYARSAADVLGIEYTTVPFTEEQFAQLLEQAARSGGTPMRYPSSPMFEALYGERYRRFIDGEGADGGFGASMPQATAAIRLRGPMGQYALRFVAMLAPGKYRPKAQRLVVAARRMGIPPPDLAAFAYGNAGVRATELPEAADVAVADVEHVLSEAYDYVLSRFEPAAAEDDVVSRNLELRHTIFSMTDDASSSRQPAQAHGKGVRTPFTDAGVVRTAARVPPHLRYARGMQGKWMLKEVLGRRVPQYPKDRMKMPTYLGVDRFIRSGALRDVWDRYQIPSIFNAETQAEIRVGDGPFHWLALAHAVWEEEMVRGDVPPIDAPLVIDGSLGDEPGSLNEPPVYPRS